MAGIAAFDRHVRRYEDWFTRHEHAVTSELNALRRFPPAGRTIEIGVGTGRFAAPLGITMGIEPSPAMGAVAAGRGIRVIRGVAEYLPLPDHAVDTIVMVTTVCFLDDPLRAFRECRRILTDSGCMIIGFVDSDSFLGIQYARQKNRNVFYRHATFFSVEDLTTLLSTAGFTHFRFCRTLFSPPDRMTAPDPVKDGRGSGAFVVIRAATEDRHE